LLIVILTAPGRSHERAGYNPKHGLLDKGRGDAPAELGLIEAVKPEGVCVYFISDTSGVFDQMSFADEIAAREALVRNGFKRCADDLRLQSFLRPPPTPFHRSADPNGPIYSSGRFWRS
jgi:hypothetical protein